MDIKNEIQDLKKNSDKNFNLCIIFATIVLFVYCYFGSFSFFESTFSHVPNCDYFKIIYHNFMAFILFFGCGFIFSRLFLKQNISKIGFRAPQYPKTFFAVTCGGFAVAIIIGVISALNSGMSKTYPLIDFAVYNEVWQIFLYFVSYVFYYIGWEFLFRGVLFQNSLDKLGVVGTILFTTLISALIHTSIGGFGKPMIETLSAIPAGIIFGYMAYKFKSLYPSLFCHTMIGICTDIFIFVL